MHQDIALWSQPLCPPTPLLHWCCPGEDEKLPNERKRWSSHRWAWSEHPRSMYRRSSDHKVTQVMQQQEVCWEDILVWKLFLEGPLPMKNINMATPLQHLEPVSRGCCNLPATWWVHSAKYYSKSLFYNFSIFPHNLHLLIQVQYFFFMVIMHYHNRYYISYHLWSFLINPQQISLLMPVISLEGKIKFLM